MVSANRDSSKVGKNSESAIRRFHEFSTIEDQKIEQIFLVLLEGNQEEHSKHRSNTIDVESLESVLDMLYEDHQSKHQTSVSVPKLPLGSNMIPQVPQRPKVYANSEILKILQKIFDNTFRQTHVYEVSSATLEQSRRELIQLSPGYFLRTPQE
jgi:hypothetical protein